MTLLQAFIYYIVRLGLYAAVAAGGTVDAGIGQTKRDRETTR